ncbi:224_t:CDS:1 [Cetraspora pellucida]|uniref:224_t:CDS:1 n=1 Tax=Cetraspora pellucida TaxID=1433469 RepID=A0ACA9MUR3_9GLOM|nr:224_t:CDS:1 [Cetraspora pellucida]
MEPPTGFTYTLPNQGHRWTGFWRSVEKKTGNKYIAKCKYCIFELEGKPDRLYQHVLKCNSWPVSQKADYLKEAFEQTIPEHKRVKHDQDEDNQEELLLSRSTIQPAKQESILN